MAKEKCYCGEMRQVLGVYVDSYKGELSKYKRTKESRKNHHHFVPAWNCLRILKTLDFLKKKIHKRIRINEHSIIPNPRFIDCGCGIGNIMILAHTLGYRVSGIEYDLATYKLAERIRPTGAKVFRGDMTTYKDYGDYDVLYFYLPMICDKKMKRFLDRAMNDMKVGAFIVSYGAYYSDYMRKDGRFKNVNNSIGAIFEKIKER